MENKLLSKISGCFLTQDNIKNILEEYMEKADVLTETINELAKKYNKLDDIQQENLIGCISVFFETIGDTIKLRTNALNDKKCGDKYYATHWQNQLDNCDGLQQLSNSIVKNASESENKNFAYIILLKNKHYVIENYRKFEEEFYTKAGQIDIPSGSLPYFLQDRAECKEKIANKIEEINDILKDSDVMMIADIILEDKEISSLIHRIEDDEYQIKNKLHHYVEIEKREIKAEIRKEKIKNGEIKENNIDDNFFDL